MFLTAAVAQSIVPVKTDVFSFPAADTTILFPLSKNFVIESSIAVTIDSDTTVSFTFDKKHNSVKIRTSAGDSLSERTVSISYKYLEFNLRPTYSLRSMLVRPDSLEPSQKKISVLRDDNSFSNIFGPEIAKSGSISRGFIVGSNRDLTLSSGFRLQLSGKLSDEIDILAALTDENTPIQPQGNTQTLQEVDNIFVEIKSPVYTATLGDFQYNSPKSEFVNINRKLQGATVSAQYQDMSPRTHVVVTGATAKGKFATNHFQGLEGVQGPYRLSGKNNDRNIIVIAGSEKVYIDGELMKRGDNNDYSIDYGSAEIIFSTSRLITSASRIAVDFEYSDRQYTRNFFGGSIENILSKNISLVTGYFREGDDQDAPIDISLSETDKQILSQAGNKTATKSAVLYVGVDSLGIGKGNYLKADTLINGDSTQFYRYIPSTPQSVYSVGFSNVGSANGDYVRDGIGQYRFVGRNNGEYLPIAILPSPQLHQVYSLQTSIVPVTNLEITGEYAASNFDQNRFSHLDDNGNSGSAFKVTLQYSPKKIKVGDINIGSMDFSLYERFKDSHFLSFDRTDIVEFGRKWSTDSLSTHLPSSEEIREARMMYVPIDGMTVSSGIGSLVQGKEFSSTRYDAAFEMKKEHFPSLMYKAENISGEENSTALQNIWFRQNGAAEYTIDFATPSIQFEQERRTVSEKLTDSVTSPSFAFSSYAPRITFTNLYGIDASSEFEWRDDKSYYQGSVIPQSNSFTQSYSLALKEVQNFSASSSVTLRKKMYEREFQSTNTNQQTSLVKIQSRYRPFSQGVDLDLYYDAASQRTAKLERIFYKVRKGEGQYVWIDANGNGIVDTDDENEFKPDRYDGEYIIVTLNSDQLIPVVTVKASARLKIAPIKFLPERKSILSRIASAVSSESYIRLEEKSTDRNSDNIYYLRLSHLLNPVTTLSGFQFIQQDLFLFENDPTFSMRFRFNQRVGINNYSAGTERNYSKERSVQTRLQVSNEISNQTDITLKNDNAVSASAINQSREIQSSSLASDFSYRPEQFLEIGFKIETTQADDVVPFSPVSSNFNGQTIRSVIAFRGNGQVRLDFSREEVVIAHAPVGYLAPYELTAGRDLGKNYLWNVISEYRLAGNLQFSLQYSGRTTNKGNIIHTGRMEVRAFF
jgi:hypothetical protein